MKIFNFLFYLVISSFFFFGVDLGQAQELPSSAPELFEIKTKDQQATLYFTPIGNTATYLINFSTASHAEEYGEKVILSSDGVQIHTIYHLAPHTTYYVKVRGDKADLAGPWSNTLSFQTSGEPNNETLAYYLHGEQKKAIVGTKLQSNIVTSPTSQLSEVTKPVTSLATTERKEVPQEMPTESSLNDQADNQTTITVVEATPAPETPSEVQANDEPEKKKCFLWWCW